MRPFLTLLINLTLLLGLAAGRLEACSPWFPQTWLFAGDEFLTEAPVLSFGVEVQQLFPSEEPPFRAVKPDRWQSPQDHASQLELAEIEDALHAQYLAESPRAEIIQSVRVFRAAVEAKEPVVPPLDPRLPEEFQWYLHGARAYRLGDHEQAREHWQSLLALPPNERRHRTTWATYMLARTALPEEATEGFRATRDCVRSGFLDTLGLAVASLGEEARVALDGGEPERAIELYLAQYHCGDPGALDSLRIVANQILETANRSTLCQVARHPIARRVITAKLLSTAHTSKAEEAYRRQWRKVLHSMAYDLIDDASRMALAAYQANSMQEASEWLDLAPPADPLAEWLRAKLLLRAGHIAEGRTKLETLFADLPPSFEECWKTPFPAAYRQSSPTEQLAGVSSAHIGAETGLLHLANGDFVEAARCFWKARQWHELAFVAERLLASDELIEIVHELRPQNLQFGQRLATLAARRLVRENRFQEATAFFDAPLRTLLAAYNTEIRDGFNYDLDDHERARAFWNAAKLLRENGMALIATELQPDFAIAHGLYDFGDEVAYRESRLKKANLLSINPRERERTADAAAVPYQRFHYRYRAAEWAAIAAQLLPADDGEAARLLITAGNWTRQTDPATANRFYRQLVVQCGRHPLGREAEQKRWFPELDRPPFEDPLAASED